MFNQTLINEALIEAGYGNPNNDRLQSKAKIVENNIIRELSSDSVLTAFQDEADIHLNEGKTVIGKPVMKLGYNLTFVTDASKLPDLTDYDPDTCLDLVMGVDFYAIKGNKGLLGIVLNGSTYEWAWVYAPSMGIGTGAEIDVNPDVWIDDIEDVINVFGKEGLLHKLNLSNYWGNNKPKDTYVVNTSFGSLITITSHEQDAHIIYTKAIDVNEISELSIPNIYLNLIKLHISKEMTNVPEKADKFQADIDRLEGKVKAGNVTRRKLADLY